MGRSRAEGILAGLVAGFAGIAASELAAGALAARESPVVAVARAVDRLASADAAETVLRLTGGLATPLLVGAVVAVFFGGFAWAGDRGREHPRQALGVYAVLASSLAATASRAGMGWTDLLPTFVAFLTWVGTLRLLLPPHQEDTDGDARRRFLRRTGLLALASVAAVGAGRVLGRSRRRVLEQRRLLRLPGVTARPAPAGADLQVEGVAPWQTPTASFFRLDTAIVPPAVDADQWALRVHGLVDRPLTISFADLLARPHVQRWMTLPSAANPVGGQLIGNAWWSGVTTRALLAEVGVHPGADAVLQTSADGWTCGTPLSALTDDRGALFAFAMNGQALSLEHGFPVRTVVPGLYGFVSACKWVVDWEVTRFDRFEAFWTRRGWAAEAPSKIASRIDVPGDGDEVPAGPMTAGGVAWHLRVGVASVEVSLDGGAWETAELGRQVSADAWVQWSLPLTVSPGEHVLRVRAVGRDGEIQTSVPSDSMPDGAQGWHQVSFTASE